MATWGGAQCPQSGRKDGAHEYERQILTGPTGDRTSLLVCIYCGAPRGKAKKLKKEGQ